MANPAYQQVYLSLKRKILSGVLPVGSLLPSEPALEKAYKVSRITIRRAVETLTRDGLVKPQQGIGTTVLDYKATQNLNRITSFTQTLAESGYEVSYKKMRITKIPADKELAEVLSIDEGEACARIERIVVASGTTYAFIINTIPYSLVPGIEEFENGFSSLYELLKEQYMITLDMAQDTLFAKAADAKLAKDLDVAVGSPVLVSNRRGLCSGKCLTYDVTYARGDMYSFNITLFK